MKEKWRSDGDALSAYVVEELPQYLSGFDLRGVLLGGIRGKWRKRKRELYLTVVKHGTDDTVNIPVVVYAKISKHVEPTAFLRLLSRMVRVGYVQYLQTKGIQPKQARSYSI